jgi:hypothetical protein
MYFRQARYDDHDEILMNAKHSRVGGQDLMALVIKKKLIKMRGLFSLSRAPASNSHRQIVRVSKIKNHESSCRKPSREKNV